MVCKQTKRKGNRLEKDGEKPSEQQSEESAESQQEHFLGEPISTHNGEKVGSKPLQGSSTSFLVAGQGKKDLTGIGPSFCSVYMAWRANRSNFYSEHGTVLDA
ncbi:hypothetical protein N7530_012149 [Penicillium desertorum]|uniref:Uncharacterized protein n=1 Tax=Penicillium desertorum TaxID=1303715 RepID=A0A9W9WER5_9EURO|nr:hypothetical protein N7530_012149 [Penicillium desertorum]